MSTANNAPKLPAYLDAVPSQPIAPRPPVDPEAIDGAGDVLAEVEVNIAARDAGLAGFRLAETIAHLDRILDRTGKPMRLGSRLLAAHRGIRAILDAEIDANVAVQTRCMDAASANDARAAEDELLRAFNRASALPPLGGQNAVKGPK